MLLLDMPDFVGNDGIDFLRLEQLQQRIRNENVTKFFYKPHNPGGDHFTAENRPV